jgi:hypothetical protein
MKKIFAILGSTLLLAGCSAPAQTVSVAYALPTNCDIQALLDLDKSYATVDQTVEGVTDSRDCAIGVPNSDVGVFFGYSVRTDQQWKAVTKQLTDEGYEQWDAGYPDADVWRQETGNVDSGANCSLSGHIAGISFSVTEPWTACDDKWNKELVGYILDHAKTKS